MPGGPGLLRGPRSEVVSERDGAFHADLVGRHPAFEEVRQLLNVLKLQESCDGSLCGLPDQRCPHRLTSAPSGTRQRHHREICFLVQLLSSSWPVDVGSMVNPDHTRIFSRLSVGEGVTLR